ncbi:hypothetical protein LMG28138_00001 [Pararobbsia alpina]|uniref:Uncharacterized protein n=1 Tax=Pararobbsia alpina TaxID=621374 RepID=A0A6S7CAL0_9BURK|nr:hypothetical protein LMG28138_00001 [Pararobbsia alpina]
MASQAASFNEAAANTPSRFEKLDAMFLGFLSFALVAPSWSRDDRSGRPSSAIRRQPERHNHPPIRRVPNRAIASVLLHEPVDDREAEAAVAIPTARRIESHKRQDRAADLVRSDPRAVVTNLDHPVGSATLSRDVDRRLAVIERVVDKVADQPVEKGARQLEAVPRIEREPEQFMTGLDIECLDIAELCAQ